MKEKIKLCHLSDSPTTTTGFSTISMEMCNYLADTGKYEIHYFAHNYPGQTLFKLPLSNLTNYLKKGMKPEDINNIQTIFKKYPQLQLPALWLNDGTPLNFNIWGTGKESYFKDVLTPRIRQIQPDLCGALLDTFMVMQPSPWFLDIDFAPSKSYFYFPSDGGGGLPLGCENVLRKVDQPVAMSKYAQTQAKEVYGIETAYIPHAISQKRYYPLSDEEKAKLRQKWGLVDKQIIGVVARNQGRKMLDRTIKSFALIAKTNPKAVLLMHTDPADPAAVFHLPMLIKRHNLENRVLFTGMKYHDTFSYSKMNDVYNLMDVFLLTTSGEGFGVPLLEAMACEVPIVATDYTTTQELLIDDGKSGEPVRLLTEVSGNWNVERGLQDDYDCANKLQLLLNDINLRREYGTAGRRKILKKYTWSVVGPQWDKLFTKMVDE